MQVDAATHHGARPSPALVKQILTSTATDEGDPADRQGAGLLDAFHAAQAALSIQDSRGTPAPRDSTPGSIGDVARGEDHRRTRWDRSLSPRARGRS